VKHYIPFQLKYYPNKFKDHLKKQQQQQQLKLVKDSVMAWLNKALQTENACNYCQPGGISSSTRCLACISTIFFLMHHHRFRIAGTVTTMFILEKIVLLSSVL
jgi:hypothetical protein